MSRYSNSDFMHDTRNQAICDLCGSFSRRLTAVFDFEEQRRLCAPCVTKHNNDPDVRSERDHISALDSVTHDDF